MALYMTSSRIILYLWSMKKTGFLSAAIAFALILTYSTAFAQNSNKTDSPWSLEKCVEYAKENNLSVRQAQLSVEQAQNNARQSKWDLLPTLGASASHNMSWGRSVNMQTLQIIRNKLNYSTSASLSSSLDIFSGMTKINAIKSGRTQLEISEQLVEKYKNDITIQIVQAYLQLLLAQEIEHSAEESCKSTAEQVDRTSKLVDAGSQAYSTLLEVQAQLAQEKSQLVDARNNVRGNKLALMQLLDLTGLDVENFDVVVPEKTLGDNPESYPQGSVGSIYESALGLPQIKSSELSLQKSRTDYNIAFGRLFPSISIQGGYGSYYTNGQQGAFFSQFDHNKQPSVGVSLSIPLFNGLTARTALRNSKIEVENQRLNLEMQKQNLLKEIQTAYNDAFSALEKMRAAEENMKSIKESFTYTENRFNVGMMNATDYNIAKSNLFKAESSYYQAKYQYIFELKILDFYRGIPIKL